MDFLVNLLDTCLTKYVCDDFTKWKFLIIKWRRVQSVFQCFFNTFKLLYSCNGYLRNSILDPMARVKKTRSAPACHWYWPVQACRPNFEETKKTYTGQNGIRQKRCVIFSKTRVQKKKLCTFHVTSRAIYLFRFGSLIKR